MRPEALGTLIPPSQKVTGARLRVPGSESEGLRNAKACSGPAGSAGRLNQGSKEGELLGVVGDHPLRVPLDCEEEAPRGFDRLDDPVGGDGADLEHRRKVADDLVVGAGHGQLSGADDLAETGSWRDRNRVSGFPPPLTRALMGRVGYLPIGEILVEAAAQSDVQDLESAADPQERQVTVAGGVDQFHLKPIPLLVDLAAPLQHDLPVEGGVDIGAPGHEEPIDGLQVLLDQGRPASTRLSAGPSTGLRTGFDGAQAAH